MKTKKNIILGIGTAILLQACGGSDSGEEQAKLTAAHRNTLIGLFLGSVDLAVSHSKKIDDETLPLDLAQDCDKGALDFSGQVATSTLNESEGSATKEFSGTIRSQKESCALKIVPGEESVKVVSVNLEYSGEVDIQTGNGTLIGDEIVYEVLTRVKRASYQGVLNVAGEGNFIPGMCEIYLTYSSEVDSETQVITHSVNGMICGEVAERVW